MRDGSGIKGRRNTCGRGGSGDCENEIEDRIPMLTSGTCLTTSRDSARYFRS